MQIPPGGEPELRVVFQLGLQLTCAADRVVNAMKAGESAVADLTDKAAVEPGQQ